MKKVFAYMLVIIIAISVFAFGCSKPAPKEQMAGAYSEEKEITPEDTAIFEAATKELIGVNYELISVSTQVVAGLNYRFTAKASPVVPNPETKDVYVYIYVPLEGEPVLTEVVDIK